MISGDHPQSYQQSVTLFSTPRDKLATPTLQSQLGHVSPEIFNAFPRRYPGLNALEAIGTGFESIYVYRTLSQTQTQRIKDLAASFDLTASFLERSFSELTGEEQSLVLLLRALVKEPPLLILDEPFSGMGEALAEKCKAYIDEQLKPRQAVILVTHFPTEEKPVSVDKLLELEEGRVIHDT
jgi:ABC-type molybdenum transport system ATPase subunit/photorepair protein PhrA